MGQLGDSTTINKSTPIQIGTANNWVSISAEQFHTLAIKSDGTLWTWGHNNFGQLGDGTTVNKSYPIQVGTGSNWINVAEGIYHVNAIKSDGTLWGWGYNFLGQLGDGTNTDRYTPVKIGTEKNWVNIVGGGSHTVGLKSDRKTFCATGYNNRGELGDGTNSNKNIFTCNTFCLPPNIPIAGNKSICIGNTATLNSTRTGKLGWYNALTGGVWISGDTAYTTQALIADTVFYVQDSTCAASVRKAISIKVNSIKTSSFNQTICSNQSYVWNGIAQNTTGAYKDTFSTTSGCDSVVTLNLQVNPTKATSFIQAICSNQSYIWNGIAQNTTGAFKDTFSTTLGCDSVVTLNLQVNPTKSSSFNQTICSNQSYVWNGIAQNTTGAYKDTFSTTLGCDSIVTLNLQVNPTKSSSFNHTICSNQSYVWNGIAQNTTGAYKDTFSTTLGCDSVVTLNLQVNPTKSSSFNQTICSNQNYVWKGIAQNSTGAYIDTFSTTLGCDSVVTLNLQVNPTKATSFNQTICSNQSYVWNGISQNSTGSYKDTFSTTLGCDSVVTLNLQVNPTKATSFNQAICSNQSYVWNGVSQNTTGSYKDTFSTTLGCDSIVTLNLQVNPTKTSSFNKTICINQTYVWNGISQNTSGSYLDTFLTSLGCDSIVTLNLAVNAPKMSINQTICGNQTYTWNGIKQSNSGQYLDTFVSYLGCDSVVTLNLFVNPVKNSFVNHYICVNQSYLWNGVLRNTAGIYLDTFTTYLGCDSIVSLNLIISSPKTTFNQTICGNQSYSWNGINQTNPGQYLDTFTSFIGCDSIVTLNLFVNPVKTSTFNKTICSNQIYIWNGTALNISGAYKDTFSTYLGCDSVVTLNLTVVSQPNGSTSTNGKTITATQTGATYQWINCTNNSIISGAINQSYTATANGQYKVVVTINSCSDTSACVAITGIGIEKYTKYEVLIFPNPSNGNFMVQANNSGSYMIKNELGQLVMTIELKNENQNKIEIDNLESGIYFMQSLEDKEFKCQKIVVTK